MIFGTVGTHTAPFDRLVKALDEYATQTPEKVIIQIGHATYEPRKAEWFRMTSSDRMAALVQEADLVVTQAADTMLEAIRAQKRVIAVPRQERFGEHIDDHQLELARKLAATTGIAVVEDVSGLASVLMVGTDPVRAPTTGEPERLVAALRDSMMELVLRDAMLAGKEASREG